MKRPRVETQRAGLVSGPSILKIVRIPSERLMPAACFIAG